MLEIKKIADYIPAFLGHEVTCLPKLINEYASNNFNNKLGNKIFWLVIIWIAFHAIFHLTFNVSRVIF